MSSASEADAATKRAVKAKWIELFNVALEADAWGQSLEAIREYTKCVSAARLNCAPRCTCLPIPSPTRLPCFLLRSAGWPHRLKSRWTT